jgi:hypothetical protein
MQDDFFLGDSDSDDEGLPSSDDEELPPPPAQPIPPLPPAPPPPPPPAAAEEDPQTVFQTFLAESHLARDNFERYKNFEFSPRLCAQTLVQDIKNILGDCFLHSHLARNMTLSAPKVYIGDIYGMLDNPETLPMKLECPNSMLYTRCTESFFAFWTNEIPTKNDQDCHRFLNAANKVFDIGTTVLSWNQDLNQLFQHSQLNPEQTEKKNRVVNLFRQIYINNPVHDMEQFIRDMHCVRDSCIIITAEPNFLTRDDYKIVTNNTLPPWFRLAVPRNQTPAQYGSKPLAIVIMGHITDFCNCPSKFQNNADGIDTYFRHLPINDRTIIETAIGMYYGNCRQYAISMY